MSRNLKPAYIHKLIKTEAPKGYKFDVGNYLHNPCFSFDYPSFFKRVAEDLETFTERRVYYFKHYDGTGEYIEEFNTFPKEDGKPGWKIAKKHEEKVLETSNRFNLNRLLALI